MTFEYLSVEDAIQRRGLRMVVVGNVPSPWGEAAKGIFHIKGIEWAAVRPWLSAAQAALPDPYDPILRFYERGGWIRQDHSGLVEIDHGATALKGTWREHFRNRPPFSAFDDASLDAIDAEARRAQGR